jgi:hypothetical protein
LAAAQVFIMVRGGREDEADLFLLPQQPFANTWPSMNAGPT